MRVTNLAIKCSAAIAVALAASAIAPSVSAQTCIRDRFGRTICGQPVPNPTYPSGSGYQYDNRPNRSNVYIYPSRGGVNRGRVYPYDPRNNQVWQKPYNPNPYYPNAGYGSSYPQRGYYRPRLDSSQVGLVINGYYRQYLGRDADPVGLSSYLRDYQNGKPLELIRREIAGSGEARNRR